MRKDNKLIRLNQLFNH